MAEFASDIEKIPTGQQVSRPASGAYGERAAVEQLKSQLPASGAGAGGPAGPGGPALPPLNPPTPTAPSYVPPASGNLPPGVPAPLAAPTNRPYEPVNTPVGGPPMAAPLTDAQRRIQLLDVLANSPSVSDETREWARLVLRSLVG